MSAVTGTVKVESIDAEDFGATATLVSEGGGIDIWLPFPIQVHYTEDAAGVFKAGASLKLTLEAN